MVARVDKTICCDIATDVLAARIAFDQTVLSHETRRIQVRTQSRALRKEADSPVSRGPSRTCTERIQADAGGLSSILFTVVRTEW